MNTAGFDFVVIVNERFLNKALAASFYDSVIPLTFEGKRKVIDSPFPLSRLTEIDFTVRLKEPPIVNAFKKGSVLLGASLEIILRSITGFSMQLDVDVEVRADPVYDFEKGVLHFKLFEAEIMNMNLNNYDIPDVLVDQINEILKDLISEGFLKQVDEIRVAPVLTSLTLPGISEGTILSISSGKADVLNEEAVMLAIDLKDTAMGDYQQIQDFSEGNDFALGVTVEALHRIFDVWWESTLAPKEGKSTSSTEIKPVQELFDALTEVFIEFPGKLFSLGFLNVYISIEKVWLEYESTSRYGKPSFKLVPGGKAEIIDVPIKIDVDARVKMSVKLDIYFDKSSFIPDKYTPWKEKVVISHRSHVYTLSKFKVDNLEVTVDRALGTLQFDEKNRIMIKVDDIDMNVDLNWSLPKFVLSWLTEDLTRAIRQNFPNLYLFPSTISEKIPGLNLTLDVRVEMVETLDDEVLISGSLGFVELPEKVSPVPMFIADRSTMTVHRSLCKLVEAIKEENKVGYYALIDALNDGYNDCRDCIKGCKAFKLKPESIVIKPS